MRAPRSALGWALPLSYVSLSAVALGQDGGGDASGTEASESTTAAPSTQGAPITVEVQPAPQPAPQVIAPYGYPQPGTALDSHLPSSSRAYPPGETDTFDLRGTSDAPAVVHGSGEAVLLEPQLGPQNVGVVPEIHVVKQGDTL